MNPAQIVFLIANFVTASTMAATAWLYFDALLIRIEVKSLFRSIAFLILAAAFALNLTPSLFGYQPQPIFFWIQSLGLWLMFVSFMLDAHAKLQATAIIAIASLIFFKSHAVLAVQTLTIALLVFQIAYSTKHRDLIPLGVSFILIAAGEFFYYLESVRGFASIQAAGSFLYIFAGVALFYWLWQYLVIRFNLKQPSFPPKST